MTMFNCTGYMTKSDRVCIFIASIREGFLIQLEKVPDRLEELY